MNKGADRVTGEVRTGSHTFAVLAGPLNGMIMQQHADRPMRLADISGDADSWISGSSTSWAAAMTDGDSEGLELGGGQTLVHALLAGLGRELSSGAAEERLSPT